jgi:hypothetical protein
MAAILLLCVSADQATAAIWRQRKLSSIQAFEHSQAGLNAFDSYVRGARGLPVRLMVDTIDEDYRFETLPHVARHERAQMARRRLRQIYRTTPYAAWAQQEKILGKRRDDRYLFAAITDPEVLSPWLRVIEANRAPVSGIHPLPMVTLSLISRLALKDANLLIVTKAGAGVRQTFCKDLKFRISRLTAQPESGTPAEDYYAEEIGNTRMYLDALTVTHVDDTVNVLILDHDNSLRDLPAALSRGRPNMKCTLIGPEEVARRLSIPDADLAASAQALHLHLLAKTAPPMDLAPPQVEVGFQIFRARQAVFAAAGFIALAGLIWAGVNEYRAFQTHARTDGLIREAQDYQARYRQVTAQFPKAPVSADELRDTVETAQKIRAAQRTPETMLIEVSKALDAVPDVHLTQVAWLHDSMPEGGDASAQSASAPQSRDRRQSGLITAQVVREADDHRAVLTRIRAFTSELAASPLVEEVRVVKLPVDISSAAGLSGSTKRESRPVDAQFQVAIVFRAGV